MLKKYFFILCAAALASATRLPQPEVRIIGGDFVPIEDVPWQVALIWNKKHFCGGSIYNQKVILTAAHCVERAKPADLKVRAGSDLKNFQGQLVSVNRIILHEEYKNLNNDILLLASPLKLGPTVKPIKLARKSPPPGTNVLATGWGSLHDEPFEINPEILLGTNLTIVDRNNCVNAHIAHKLYIPASAICAYDTGRGICRGDSGGPVVTLHDRRLIGIVSAVFRCAGKLPELYTDVASLRKWIINTVKRNVGAF